VKVLARTRQSIMLVDNFDQEVCNDRPYVINYTPFFEARVAKGEVEIIATDLADTATDAEFLAYLKDSGDVDLAVAAFTSTPVVEPKKSRKKTAQLELELDLGS
jgi:hypothetical protein